MPDGGGSVAGIVLGAGTSSRMGTNKLLLELGHETVIARASRQACEAGLDPVIVVLGFEADHAARALNGLDVRIVVNERYEHGINTSVCLGITSVPHQCDAAVVMLADMTLVTAPMIRALVQRYRAGRDDLVVSMYGDVPAPPTLYDRSLFAEFDGQPGEGCGKRIVRAHWDSASKVQWPADLLVDLDVPEDLLHLQHRTSPFRGGED